MGVGRRRPRRRRPARPRREQLPRPVDGRLPGAGRRGVPSTPRPPLGLTAATRGVLGFGLALADFDADGRLDLVQANGHVLDRARLGVPFAMRPTLLRNAGGRLVDAAAGAGPWFARADPGPRPGRRRPRRRRPPRRRRQRPRRPRRRPPERHRPAAGRSPSNWSAAPLARSADRGEGPGDRRGPDARPRARRRRRLPLRLRPPGPPRPGRRRPGRPPGSHLALGPRRGLDRPARRPGPDRGGDRPRGDSAGRADRTGSPRDPPDHEVRQGHARDGQAGRLASIRIVRPAHQPRNRPRARRSAAMASIGEGRAGPFEASRTTSRIASQSAAAEDQEVARAVEERVPAGRTWPGRRSSGPGRRRDPATGRQADRDVPAVFEVSADRLDGRRGDLEGRPGTPSPTMIRRGQGPSRRGPARRVSAGRPSPRPAGPPTGPTNPAARTANPRTIVEPVAGSIMVASPSDRVGLSLGIETRSRTYAPPAAARAAVASRASTPAHDRGALDPARVPGGGPEVVVDPDRRRQAGRQDRQRLQPGPRQPVEERRAGDQRGPDHGVPDGLHRQEDQVGDEPVTGRHDQRSRPAPARITEGHDRRAGLGAAAARPGAGSRPGPARPSPAWSSAGSAAAASRHASRRPRWPNSSGPTCKAPRDLQDRPRQPAHRRRPPGQAPGPGDPDAPARPPSRRAPCLATTSASPTPIASTISPSACAGSGRPPPHAALDRRATSSTNAEPSTAIARSPSRTWNRSPATARSVAINDPRWSPLTFVR